MPEMKLKKTGKPVSLHFLEIDKFVAGKTKNMWVFTNGAAAAAQLGLLPPTAGEPKAKEAKPALAKPAEPASKSPTASAAKGEPVAKPATTPAPATKPAPSPATKATPAPAAKPAPEPMK